MEINFHRKIYPRAIIDKAVDGFQKVADFKISSKGNYYSIRINNYNKKNKLEIKGNFLNYTLILLRLKQ